jgi:hypothetical protein
LPMTTRRLVLAITLAFGFAAQDLRPNHPRT